MKIKVNRRIVADGIAACLAFAYGIVCLVKGNNWAAIGFGLAALTTLWATLLEWRVQKLEALGADLIQENMRLRMERGGN
jgi:hypothetical protein